MRPSPLPRRVRTAGFTLLELMVSIALVLIIILGVNQVFSLTSQTVGAGQVFTEINRDSRSVQTTIYSDLKGAAIDDGPFFIIRSESIRAWRNKADQSSDSDGDLRTLNGITVNPIPLFSLTDHTHRADRLLFFSRDQFRRQTGNGDGGSAGAVGTLSADMSSNEAFLCYGHLRRWNNTASSGLPSTMNDFNTNTDPGAGNASNNPNNLFATQWILGRVAMTMVEPNIGGAITDRAGQGQDYYPVPTNTTTFAPFGANSTSTYDSRAWSFASARYDLIGASIDRVRKQLASAVTTAKDANPNAVTDYWNPPTSFRFPGEVRTPRPINSAFSAWTVPAFVPGCTQFCVEYAGDFCKQDNVPTSGTYGRPLPRQPTATNPTIPPEVLYVQSDGEVDFEVVGGIRRIRWYGFPRDTADSGAINSQSGSVVPFSTFLRSYDGSATAAPWEHGIPANSPADGSSYTCAWGPDTVGLPRPKMIRITMTIDDTRASGARIGTGHTFEYVIELK